MEIRREDVLKTSKKTEKDREDLIRSIGNDICDRNDEALRRIREMEKALGLDAVKPTHVSPGIRDDLGAMTDDEVSLAWKWYEEQLREAYDSIDKGTVEPDRVMITNEVMQNGHDFRAGRSRMSAQEHGAVIKRLRNKDTDQPNTKYEE